jgi:uncharacterized cupredoxin-like copper-binding protein
VLLAGLSTGNKIGLAVVGAVFIAFALTSSFVIPKRRPDYPGKNGMSVFIIVSIALFAGMLTAVSVSDVEAEAKGGEKSGAPSGPAKTIPVTESEFKIVLPAESGLQAGNYTFAVKNAGKIGHDLAITGPGVSGTPKTAIINAGGTSTLSVSLKAGTYTLFCTVPGHRAAGMVTKLTIGAGAPSAPAKTIPVTESEFKIVLPAESGLQAGNYTFAVKNAGKIGHDLAITGAGISGTPKTAIINAGGTSTLSVSLKAGTYTLFCTVPGHRAAGMVTKLTIG